MNQYLTVFLLSMTPVGELRVSLPVALLVYKMPLEVAFLLSYIGNIIPPLLVVFLLGPVSEFLRRRYKIFDRFFNWLFSYTRGKSEMIERYKMVGLIIFVGIPLPFTGAWTGSIASFLLGISPFKAILSILIGVFIAGVIVTLSCLGIISIF